MLGTDKSKFLCIKKKGVIQMDKKSIHELKSEMIHVRITRKDKEMIQTAAKNLGLTTSGVVSMAVYDFLKKTNNKGETYNDNK